MKHIVVIFAFLLLVPELSAKDLYAFHPDSLMPAAMVNKSELFYDSLEVRAHRHRFTRLALRCHDYQSGGKISTRKSYRTNITGSLKGKPLLQ